MIASLRNARIVLGIAGVLWIATTLQADEQSRSVPPEQLIAQHLALGKALLEQGDYAQAQARFQAILQLDATHPEALRLMTTAQRDKEAVEAKAARARAQLREQAQDLAFAIAQEKANERARQDAQAQQQLAAGREQHLKRLYRHGMSLYRQHDFQGAMDTFGQMVPMAPEHPLVRDAQRMMTKAEGQLAAERARRAAQLSIDTVAPVSDLERQLTVKRIELETTFKYAKIAVKERNYETAVKLLQRILAQDPQYESAQQLLQQAQLAQLKKDEERLQRAVQLDEQSMVNEVVKSQLLPPPPSMKPISVLPQALAGSSELAARLRQPISIDFTEVALGDVLEFIGDAANISIIPSPRLDLKTRRVSLKITELPLELALKYLAKSQALDYRVEQDAILIATAEEFSSQPMETRVFFLQGGLGPFALETAALSPHPALQADSIKTLVEKTIPQPSGSRLVMDQRSGSLIVTNTGANLTLIEQLLSQLDVTPVQVLIEARFMELTMTDLDQLGFEAILNGDYALNKKGAGDGTQGPGNIIAKNGGVKFANLSRQDEGGNLTLQGVLSGVQFEAVLHALEESKKTKTLSAPRVTTLNNQSATIRVVEEFNYPTRYEVSLIQFDINGDGDFDDAGETEFANVPKDFKKRDVGILLNVTPSVGKDLKTITLVLAPEVSSAGEFRDLGSGVTVPDFTSQRLTTSVIIEDGQTVVLGGLMKDTTANTVTKVPLLGDLPLLGGLFRQREETSTRKNLLIFITARLLAPRGQTT